MKRWAGPAPIEAARLVIALTAPAHGVSTLPAINLRETDASFETRNAAIAEIGAAMMGEIKARSAD